jgi:predicted GIY-YIG superfamily endonuclease
VRPFDHKFGADFLAAVPREPGVYRIYDSTGGLLYVGKASDLRRRLAQYRTTRRTKKDRKRRALVRAADRIEWQTCASELDASLTEIGLMTLRPGRNVAGAFPWARPTRCPALGRLGAWWAATAASVRASRPCLARSGLSSHDAGRPPGSGTSSDMAHHREGRADDVK